MPIIEATGLTKRFEDGTKALKGISFSIVGGKITGLVGPDGAGKTTLIRILTGLLPYSDGSLYVLGQKMPCNKSDFLQMIGYMPQKFGLYEDLSVDENLNLYAELQGVENKKERIDELLAFTSLKPFRGRLAGKLSGGMKQKLGLACALIKKPKLLLLDEPLSGLNAQLKMQIISFLKQIHQQYRLPMLYVSHHAEELTALNAAVHALEI